MTKDLHKPFWLESLQSRARYKLALYTPAWAQGGGSAERDKWCTCRHWGAEVEAQVSQGPVCLDGDHADVRLHCRHSAEPQGGRNTDLCLWSGSCKDTVTQLFSPPAFSLSIALTGPAVWLFRVVHPLREAYFLFLYSNHSGLRFLFFQKTDPCPSTRDMSGFPC